MRREENLAFITSKRPATTLGLIPKNRIYSEEQMRSALIFSDTDSRRQITVSGMGEFSLPPDRVKLIVIITSTKSNANEAKTSVERRLKYVEQTLRNYGVKDADKSIARSVTRRDTMFEAMTEITAIFVDIQRYQNCHNILVEKLDAPVVRVLDPVFSHSTLRLENIKRQASVQAVRNAKHTAEDIARTVGLHVAKAVQITEENYQEKEGALAVSGQPTSFQNLIDAKTIVVNVTLNITFELKAKERQRKKDNAQ
ncbi:unnamed protein product [Rotaria magnacalcarata]|uniref:Uncharacterized protein n=1 Tax=Rotaria magnacalcarata TaxID=392030 RepID=A0A815NLI4_9BILA|nr:unnamed protein product [Rotaria magnacalcarata]CAF1439534.1 unnamed protein product [Rotaria magnacalcarata]CAF1943817.1 unnamed protein product [Rotaria magnacalcarata]CAF2097581.1 unnamed protein product [Rotaria magnacalcarata]CAF2162682.1 unnamed protein product [Rotaria magnacalcarata]